MNILFMAQDVSPAGRTGDAVHLREIIWNLAELGNDIWLVARDLQVFSSEKYLEWNKILDKFHKHEKIHMHLIKTRLKLSFAPFKNLLTFITCYKILNKNKIDIIYSRNFDCKMESLFSGLFNKPIVLEINGITDDEKEDVSGKRRNKLVKYFIVQIRRIFLKKATRIICVTQELKKALESAYRASKSRVVVISNGVDTSLFIPKDAAIERNKLNLDPKSKVAVFVGALVSWQCLDELLRAIPFIKSDIPEFKLIIIGDGHLKNQLMETAQSLNINESVLFTGYLSYDIIPSYLNSSDICINLAGEVKTKRGSSGNASVKAYEYMACGKPILFAKNSGIEWIKKYPEGSFYITVNKDDPKEVANAVITLFRDENMRIQMGKQARQIVVSGYSWQIVAIKVQSVLKEAYMERG